MLKILKKAKSKVFILLVAGAFAPPPVFAGHGGHSGGHNGGHNGGGNHMQGGQQQVPQMQSMPQVQRFTPPSTPVIAAKNGNTGFTGIGLPNHHPKTMSGQMMPLNVPKNLLPNSQVISVKPLSPTVPLQPVKPTLPTGPVVPVHPIGPTFPVHPIKPTLPTGPVVPVHPIGPTFPVHPVKPTLPTGPVVPVHPIGPIGPIGPVTPTNPLPPVTPVPPVSPPTTPPTAPPTPTAPSCNFPWLFPVGLGGLGGGYGGGYGNGGYSSGGYCAPVNSAPVVIPSNAVAPATYVAAAGSVDLVIEDIQLFEPATLVAGPAYRVKFRNQGLAPAGAFRVGIFAALEGKMTDSQAVVDVQGLEAGQSVEIALRLPQSALQLVSGSGQATGFDTLAVMVDVDSRVNESDKANNAAVIARSSLEAAR